MRKRSIVSQYYDWLVSKISDDDYSPVYYTELLGHLFEAKFYWVNPMDVSRIDDGIDLRYRFGRECGYSQAEIASTLDIRDCSILEVMVALAIRAEEHILGDNMLGDRTPEWFWVMVDSMGLSDYTDDHYDPGSANDILINMMNRDYSPTGEGSFFIVYDGTDMRKEEIWYQMMHWINENNVL